jgi:hypothetical protein
MSDIDSAHSMQERSGSFGRCADRRRRHAIRNVQKQRANDCSDHTEQSEPIKSTLENREAGTLLKQQSVFVSDI